MTVHLTFKTKKNGHKFLTFYICPRSSVDLGQWDLGIKGKQTCHTKVSTKQNIF